MTASMDDDVGMEPPFLDTLEGEISFFRSVMRARPVGIHRHFHILAIRNAIHRDTGHWVQMEELWDKLRDCYDLEILESIEADGYDTPNSKGSPAMPVRSPSPSDDLFSHPYFRQEFTLPHDPSIEAHIARRRMRATASIPSSSPTPPPLSIEKPTRTSKKGKGRLKNMAGLIGGDSDSSALTQESGDEGFSPAPPRLGSVATGTEAGTEYAEDEDDAMEGQSPAEPLSKAVKKSSKSSKKSSANRKSSSSRNRKRKR